MTTHNSNPDAAGAARLMRGDHSHQLIKPGTLVTDGTPATYVVLAQDGDAPGARVRAREVATERVVEGVIARSGAFVAALAGVGVTGFVPLPMETVKEMADKGLVNAHAALRDFGMPAQWPPQGEGIARLAPPMEAILAEGGGWAMCSANPAIKSYYTVGLHAMGLPELWLNGLSHGTTANLGIETLAHWMAQRTLAVATGAASRTDFTDAFPLLRSSGGMPAYVVPLDDFLVKALAPLAYIRSQGAARLAQVVWPDQEGRFPWEEGCTVTGLQEMLCAEPTGFKPIALVDGTWQLKA